MSAPEARSFGTGKKAFILSGVSLSKKKWHNCKNDSLDSIFLSSEDNCSNAWAMWWFVLGLSPPTGRWGLQGRDWVPLSATTCQCLAPHLGLISVSCWMSLLNMGFHQQEEPKARLLQSHWVTGSSGSILSVMSSPRGLQQILGCTSCRHWPIKSGTQPKAHFHLLAPPQKNSILGIPASRTFPQIPSLKKVKSWENQGSSFLFLFHINSQVCFPDHSDFWH